MVGTFYGYVTLRMVLRPWSFILRYLCGSPTTHGTSLNVYRFYEIHIYSKRLGSKFGEIFGGWDGLGKSLTIWDYAVR